MNLTARDIMTPHVKSVPARWSLQEFATFLSKNGISGSPVVNDAGEIVGIATLTDLAAFHPNPVTGIQETLMTPEEQKEARRLRRILLEEMSKVPAEVRDIMTPLLISVDEETPVKDVANIMLNEKVHRVFVKRGGQIVGIITGYDMLKVIAGLE